MPALTFSFERVVISIDEAQLPVLAQLVRLFQIQPETVVAQEPAREPEKPGFASSAIIADPPGDGAEIKSRDVPVPAATQAGAAPPVAPVPVAPKLQQKTPERVRRLQQIWYGPMSRQQIIRELADLPGAPLIAENLSIYVVQWGIAKSGKEEERQAEITRRNRPASPAVAAVASGVAAGLGEPIVTTEATIRAWAGEKGIVQGRVLDLGPINAKRRQLEQRPFALQVSRSQS